MSYEVHTSVFDGPFDLLLHLILREQVDLYEINLSEIVDAYLVELDRMERLDLEVATEFLLIAATLVELKARRLLPEDTEIDLDDELGLWEERDLLLARLVECKTFKDAALVLRKLSAHAARSYPRRVGPVEDRFIGLLPDLLANVEATQLRDAFMRATAPKPVIRVATDHIAPISFSVGDAVNELVIDLPERGRVSFRQLTANLVDRIEETAGVTQKDACSHLSGIHPTSWLGSGQGFSSATTLFSRSTGSSANGSITGAFGNSTSGSAKSL